MQRLRNKLKYFLRYYGIGRVPAFLLPKLVPSMRKSQRFIDWKESAFDKTFGVQTLGTVEVEDLDYDGESRQHAVEYRPSSGIALGIILEEMGIDHSQFCFVDYGCGKGRVLCLAAEFPFQAVIGVELSASLCDAAKTNIHNMYSSRKASTDIQCVQTDATLFQVPETPLVLYFFNPFGEAILSQVIRHIESTCQIADRDVFVIYSNPVHRVLFDDSPLWDHHQLRRGPTPDNWAVYRMNGKGIAAN